MKSDFALGKDKYLEAIEFIKKKHDGQFRKSSMAPYWIHPIQVATLVIKFKESHKIDDLVIASLLHDTVEDTDTSIEEIKVKYGDTVASLVSELTNDAQEIKKIGKTEYMKTKMIGLSSWALVIKLCDRLNNVSDLYYVDDSFRNKYVKETREVLAYLETHRPVISETHRRIIEDIHYMILYVTRRRE